jgi:hypothetical protein
VALKAALSYNHVYEGRNNLFGEVISEEDEDEDDEAPSHAFMWSEAVAAFQVDDAPAANHVANGDAFNHLTRPAGGLAKRSKSESDLGKVFDAGVRFQNPALPASARRIEASSKKKRKAGPVGNGTGVLGSVGQLLHQFRRQKSWHKFKPVSASVPAPALSDRPPEGDVTTFV